MILLDTHVAVWLLTDPAKLSRNAHDAILRARRTGENLCLSPVSLYELAYAAVRNRLPLNSKTMEFIAALQSIVQLAPLSAEIAVYAAELPEPFHGDPIDRIIAATATVEGMTLITKDGKIRQSNVCKCIW
jgi:PIN domain nuclease of toxin-antitoxin system